jgi:DNA-binding NtrC family response regulator
MALANDAESALALFKTVPFDAIITDYEMPGRNGLWLLSEVRDLCPTTSRVLTSGGHVPRLSTHIASGLVHEFAEKPVDPQEMLAVYRRMQMAPAQ